MIWIILAALGIPTWMLVGAILLLVLRARALGRRPGDLPVRMRTEGSKRWQRGHGIWVHDVFVFSGTMKFWGDQLVGAVSATTASPDSGCIHPPRGSADTTFTSIVDESGDVHLVATAADADPALALGPFADAADGERP